MTAQDIITAEEITGFLHIKTQTLYDNRWRAQSRCPLFRQERLALNKILTELEKTINV